MGDLGDEGDEYARLCRVTRRAPQLQRKGARLAVQNPASPQSPWRRAQRDAQSGSGLAAIRGTTHKANDGMADAGVEQAAAAGCTKLRPRGRIACFGAILRSFPPRPRGVRSPAICCALASSHTELNAPG